MRYAVAVMNDVDGVFQRSQGNVFRETGQGGPEPKGACDRDE